MTISNGDVIVTNFEYAYHATLGEEACGDTQCYKLELVRKTDDVTWPKVIYYVEKRGEPSFKASYYSLDNKLMKEVLYRDFQMVLGKMRPMKIIVKEARHGNSYR